MGTVRRQWAGALPGDGGFSLCPGTIKRELLRLHQIPAAADDSLAYDATWNAVSLALVVSLLLLRRLTDSHPSSS